MTSLFGDSVALDDIMLVDNCSLVFYYPAWIIVSECFLIYLVIEMQCDDCVWHLVNTNVDLWDPFAMWKCSIRNLETLFYLFYYLLTVSNESERFGSMRYEEKNCFSTRLLKYIEFGCTYWR